MNTESPEEIADGIFELCDQEGLDASFESLSASLDDDENEDKEADISIKELQQIVEKCGIKMSADDAFEVIKDIDEDGNGRLNKEEFFEMLKRLGVV